MVLGGDAWICLYLYFMYQFKSISGVDKHSI